MNLESEKIELIEYILATNDENKLRKIKESIQSNAKENKAFLAKYAQGMEEKVDVQKLKKEQNVQKLTRTELKTIRELVNFNETKEEFEKMLTGI